MIGYADGEIRPEGEAVLEKIERILGLEGGAASAEPSESGRQPARASAARARAPASKAARDTKPVRRRRKGARGESAE